MSAAVIYRIEAQRPETHVFELTLTVAQPDPQGQRLRLPAWIPGSYMIRDFARHVIAVSASDASGSALLVEKIAKSEWRCAPTSGPLTVRYQVYAWDLSVRGAHLDQTHGFFNGTSVFLAVVGQESARHVLEIMPPEGTHDWKVATSLSPVAGTPEFGFGHYEAANYDELIDHPVEMGQFTQARFMVGDVLHDVVITGRHRADTERLCRDLAKICRTQIEFFGTPAPFSRYVFLVMAVGQGYGGLEHRSSTALLCSRDDLPLSTEPQENISDRYKTFLGLCSHEYFHSWNVKRIKPTAFLPYELAHETMTPQLWAYEGITSYYDDLMLYRAGIISAKEYIELLAQQLTRLRRTPGRFQQSVSDASRDAWIKYYKPDENSANSSVSYYIKGALIALCVDLLMRDATDHRYSLDTVMRALWQDYAIKGVGTEDDTIPAIVTRLTGERFEDFWQRALHQAAELPCEDLLTQQGLRLAWRAADNANDLGGAWRESKSDRPAKASLGAKLQAAEGGVSVISVVEGGPAQTAGLSAGDVVVAVNGLRVNMAAIERLFGQYQAGDAWALHAFRRDELMQFTVTLSEMAEDTCMLALPDNDVALARVEQWLRGS